MSEPKRQSGATARSDSLARVRLSGSPGTIIVSPGPKQELDIEGHIGSADLAPRSREAEGFTHESTTTAQRSRLQ